MEAFEHTMSTLKASLAYAEAERSRLARENDRLRNERAEAHAKIAELESAEDARADLLLDIIKEIGLAPTPDLTIEALRDRIALMTQAITRDAGTQSAYWKLYDEYAAMKCRAEGAERDAWEAAERVLAMEYFVAESRREAKWQSDKCLDWYEIATGAGRARDEANQDTARFAAEVKTLQIERDYLLDRIETLGGLLLESNANGDGHAMRLLCAMANDMNAPGGPRCWCGRSSAMQSGSCAKHGHVGPAGESAAKASNE